MNVFMFLPVFQYSFACKWDWMWVVVCMSSCTGYSSAHVCSRSLDVGALGVIGGGGCWRVPTPLCGVVVSIVVLVGAGLWGLWGAAGENAPAQQAEDAAKPSSVEGEAERHEAVLLVGADGKPDCRHHAAQCWGEADAVVQFGIIKRCQWKQHIVYMHKVYF